MNQSTRRIPFAYFHKQWDPTQQTRITILTSSQKVLASEYIPTMKGKLFCPECLGDLSRVPERNDITANGVTVYYRHRKGSGQSCSLRTTTAPGKVYTSEEEVTQAINNDQLAIIHEFAQEEPSYGNSSLPGQFDNGSIEDKQGPLSQVPIGRHNGETVSVPSIITTIAGLCRNFDQNLMKYFFLPNSQFPVRLKDTLIDTKTITEVDETPRLYFAKVVESKTAAWGTPRAKSTRMTKLECNNLVPDFFLKTYEDFSIRRGITDNISGCYIIFYGRVSPNGIGLSFAYPKWGEVGVVPERYNELLDGF